jgi:hypothetical protein
MAACLVRFGSVGQPAGWVLEDSSVVFLGYEGFCSSLVVE